MHKPLVNPSFGLQGAWRVRERMLAAGLVPETHTCNALIRAAARDVALAPAARALHEEMRAAGPAPDALTLSALFDAAHRWGLADGAWLLDVRARTCNKRSFMLLASAFKRGKV